MNIASSADRYAGLLAPPVCEQMLIEAPRQFSELELQAHWFAGDFGSEFTTTTGATVRVVQFGVWNHEAGPDFAHAAISIDDGDPLQGSIEFDMDVRDWERHGHGANPEYEKVVLHVFTQKGAAAFFTRTAAHKDIPQVHVDLQKLAGSELPSSLPEARPGRCSGPLADLPEDKVREILVSAAQFRMRRKSAALARLSEVHGRQEALYQSLATTLGYKSNKLPFTLLAQRLPLRLLQQSKDDLEALLFGVGGFLPERDLSGFDPATRGYLRELWERWWARRSEMSRLCIAPAVWRLGGQRPMNHPQRRLAALAQIVHHWPGVRKLADAFDVKKTIAFFTGLHDPYWDRHYTLTSKASPAQMALVGESRVVDMLANVFLPLSGSDCEGAWKAFLALPAPLANRRVETAAARLFGQTARGREMLKCAALQQGLIQVYEDFCLKDASDCAQCRFPQQLAKW